jgi:hypothetical protein
VLVALRDWTLAARQIDAASLRRRHEAMELLSRLEPPEDLRATHDALLEAWEARIHDEEPDPAVRVARGLELRAATDALLQKATGAYATELSRLEALTSSEPRQVGEQFAREAESMLRRIDRARPPASRGPEHDELLRLLREFADAQLQLYDAVAHRDHDRALSLAGDYGRAAEELKAATDAFYARVRT